MVALSPEGHVEKREYPFNLSEVPQVLLIVYVRASELRAIFGDRPRWKIT